MRRAEIERHKSADAGGEIDAPERTGRPRIVARGDVRRVVHCIERDVLRMTETRCHSRNRTRRRNTAGRRESDALQRAGVPLREIDGIPRRIRRHAYTGIDRTGHRSKCGVRHGRPCTHDEPNDNDRSCDPFHN